ncbi:MAG: DEAD/DEAH box helicase, partial [Methanobacterium sp.]
MGLSGSTYRLDQGEICEESHKVMPFFTHKVYDTAVHPGIPRLIAEGYLAHIHTLNTNVHVDLDGVKLVNGDYSKDDAGKKFDLIIDDAIADMRQQFDDNNIETAIIFVSNLTNAKHVLSTWGDNSTMRIVCGDDEICTKSQRKQAIDWIKNGTGKRYLINVDILAEGFDYTALQCVVLLRATKSPGLMSQIIFRIIRPHADKDHSFLL